MGYTRTYATHFAKRTAWSLLVGYLIFEYFLKYCQLMLVSKQYFIEAQRRREQMMRQRKKPELAQMGLTFRRTNGEKWD